MIRVFIGTESGQLIPQKVLAYSIRKNASAPVNIRFVRQQAPRLGGTNFGFVRFCVPSMAEYRGRAIYLDADQLVFADIKELHDALEPDRALALVKNPEGTFGGKPVARVNQSSVMVMDAEKLRDWDPAVLFASVVGNRDEPGEGRIRYRDFMMLSWMDSARIGELDSRWNHFNLAREDTKLVHFSHVRSQPWKALSHPLTGLWKKWLFESVAAGAVGRFELLREILRGHVHPHFLGAAFTARKRK